MVRVRVLDLDGSLAAQAGLFPAGEAEWVPARDWGPRVRLACDFAEFRRFRAWLDEALGDDGPSATLYGSGDFHHVTLALLGRVRGPFNLLVVDGHPDWMRGIPFLHCGTWLRHALRLPGLRRAFHCGGETDFENGYRLLAPWREIRSGRVVVFPSRRRFARGGWSRLGVRPLLAEGATPAETLRGALRPFRDELGGVPLYVTIDKDVLVADDASVNWDSGHLRLSEAASVVATFVEAAGGSTRRGRPPGRLVADPPRPPAQPPLRPRRPPQPVARPRRRLRAEPPRQRCAPPRPPAGPGAVRLRSGRRAGEVPAVQVEGMGTLQLAP